MEEEEEEEEEEEWFSHDRDRWRGPPSSLARSPLWEEEKLEEQE